MKTKRLIQFSVRGQKRHQRRIDLHYTTLWAELKAICPPLTSDVDTWAAEADAEAARIRASFPKREPAVLGDDFFQGKLCFCKGGTAVRRNARREAKRQHKAQQRQQRQAQAVYA